MKLLKIMICAIIASMVYSPVVPKEIVHATSGMEKDIELLINHENIEEKYDTSLVIEMKIKADNFKNNYKLVILSKMDNIVSTCENDWKDKEKEWTTVFSFSENIEDATIALMEDDKVVYRSPSFTIDKKAEGFSLTMNGETLKGNHYVSSKEVNANFMFDEEIDVEKSKIVSNGQELIPVWNDKHYEASLQFNKEGNYYLVCEFLDIYGHMVKKNLYITIDKQIPEIEIFIDEKKITDFESYYGQNISLIFKASADMDTMNSNVWINGSLSKIEWYKKEHKYYGQLDLKEGDYQLEYEIKDYVGNTSKKTFSLFSIDTTKPTVQIANKGSLFDHNQDIDLLINDAHIDVDKSVLQVIHNGEEQIRNLDWHGDTNTKTFKFHTEEEGAYALRVLAKDMAGNQVLSDACTFAIDKTTPALALRINHQDVSEITNYMTNKSVLVDFGVKDEYLGDTNITVFKNDNQIVNTNKLTSLEFKGSNNKNDNYTIIFTANDLAGNVSEKRVNFAIHTKASPITIHNDIFKNKASNNSWIPQIEDNGNQIHILSTILYKDNMPVLYRWGDQIEQEGEYVLNIIGEDGAGNPTMLNQNFHFSIDKTAPIVNLMNGNIVKLNEMVKISIQQDNPNKRNEEHFSYIKINGEKVDDVKGHFYEFKVHKAGEYTIECKVSDDAGNTSIKTWKIQAVTSFLYPNRYELLYIALASIVLVTLGVLLRRYVKRRA